MIYSLPLKWLNINTTACYSYHLTHLFLERNPKQLKKPPWRLHLCIHMSHPVLYINNNITNIKICNPYHDIYTKMSMLLVSIQSICSSHICYTLTIICYGFSVVVMNSDTTSDDEMVFNESLNFTALYAKWSDLTIESHYVMIAGL